MQLEFQPRYMFSQLAQRGLAPRRNLHRVSSQVISGAHASSMPKPGAFGSVRILSESV